ncbi:hypothetical protein C2845_PM07G14730 [Panicum miliaceum]|uniref:Leucine-rich repeat-containing N-terminal plant-type domain-containing protein n=1 Tax=Panicum miliaceum TaxID=4540 RepID=A0A3L6STF2_PANMI|nr:hypothetical protein C2845_PM07G14730 [Panicum miliaceum]
MAAPLLLRLQGEAPAIFVFVLFVTQALSSLPAYGRAISGGGCVASERDALLSFKESLLDPAGRLSSWRGEDCCQWKGVGCSDRIGLVIRLDLRWDEILLGHLTPSEILGPELQLLQLHKHTSVSGQPQQPKVPRSLRRGVFGERTPQLGNLSRLQYLNLSGYYSPKVSGLSCLQHLSSLESLDMGWVDLSLAGDWVRMVNMLPNLKIISLPGCGLSSTISALAHSNLTHLEVLDLSGDSPQCRQGSSFDLLMVDLKNNNLSGEFPCFLQNAANLSFLDLSYSKFSGSVPTCMVEQMLSLEVLILRSNMFHGHLPKQLAKLAGLHYLDVAHNNISGNIPSSLARLRAMTQASDGNGAYNYSSDSIATFLKDRELTYAHESTKHIVLIDMSSNSFTGYIPKELSLLKGLRSLNLSNNQITGPIPDDIGALRQLESFDLSYNYFTGEIPSSLSDLSFLSCLNLSYNDLSGRIPSGQQLQTLNNQYMYIGNPGLCGPPLLNNCSMNGTNPNVSQEHEGGRSSLYLSTSMGFVMGLWTVFCAMLFMKTWRIAYFQLLDRLYDKVYVQVAISKAAFLRKRGDEET